MKKAMLVVIMFTLCVSSIFAECFNRTIINFGKNEEPHIGGNTDPEVVVLVSGDFYRTREGWVVEDRGKICISLRNTNEKIAKIHVYYNKKGRIKCWKSSNGWNKTKLKMNEKLKASNGCSFFKTSISSEYYYFEIISYNDSFRLEHLEIRWK